MTKVTTYHIRLPSMTGPMACLHNATRASLQHSPSTEFLLTGGPKVTWAVTALHDSCDLYFFPPVLVAPATRLVPGGTLLKPGSDNLSHARRHINILPNAHVSLQL